MSPLDWKFAMAPIRESIPDIQFRRWFSPLKLLRQESDRVVLGVPNRFHEKWLKEKFSSELNRIAQHYGDNLQLEFELVREENIDAALSTPTNSPEDLTLSQKIENAAASNLTEEKESTRHLRIVNPEAPELPHVDPPNLPQIDDKFLDLGFNHIALECAKMVVAGNPDVNPLLICGGTGMGKTHLLTEIGKRLYAEDPNLRIRYTNFETFTSEVVQSIQTNTNHIFKKKYRDETDVLLFDDVDGLTKRTRSQEELLHIFNELLSRGGRIVFASRTQPNAMETFPAPLKSRLVSCVMVDIREPTYDERVELLNRKAIDAGITIEISALRSLAGRGQTDVRELVGSLIRLHVKAKLENRVVDQEYLGQNSSWHPEARTVSLEEIISLVETNFGVSRIDLLSKSRKEHINWARQVTMYLARTCTLLSLEQIGKKFGRDHATVIHAHTKVTEAIEKKPNRRYEVEFLKTKIASRNGSGTADSE